MKRFLSFSAAVAVGACVFGLFWSVQVQGRSVGKGPFCPPDGATQNKDMCVNNAPAPNVPPATQSAYLNDPSKHATCGACPTSAN